jgi:hypothetical protein
MSKTTKGPIALARAALGAGKAAIPDDSSAKSRHT